MQWVVGIITFVVVVVILLYVNVFIGLYRRDRALLGMLDELNEKLRASAASVTPESVARLARLPELRRFLYEALKKYNRTDLFPADLLTLDEQARCDLAYWLCHPNELAASPDAIEVLTTVSRTSEGRSANYFVLRFKKDPPHWSAERGWTVGIAGPYFEGHAPYSKVRAFSRFEPQGKMSPDALVDWYRTAMEPREDRQKS